MIDKAAAMAIAQAYVARRQGPKTTELVLQEQATMDLPFGWVFFYNTRASLQSDAFSASALGNAPFIVDRDDGSIHVTGTARGIGHYIADYERQQAKRVQGKEP